MKTKLNVDSFEIARFSAQAQVWWDPDGEFKPLHQINPVRLAYVRQKTVLKDKQVLDVGCGGGLLAESMASESAFVTGIDMSEEALKVARNHATQKGLMIDYEQSTAEAWAADHARTYDVVICMELVEHVPEPASLVRACSAMVRPGGDIFFSTVNRTWLARALVIGVSEFVLGIVRKGTHRYERLVRPAELISWSEIAGLVVMDLSGLRYLPFIGYAGLCRDTRMNYLMHAKKQAVG